MCFWKILCLLNGMVLYGHIRAKMVKKNRVPKNLGIATLMTPFLFGVIPLNGMKKVKSLNYLSVLFGLSML